MKRWIAILMILCLAVGSLAGCKGEEEKKSAAAGGYVEGSADVGGDEVTIVDNQGGGVGNTSNSGDQGGDADLDQDTDSEQDTDTNKGNTNTDKGNTNTDKGNTNTDKGNTNTDKGNTDTNTDQNNGTDDKKEPEQDSEDEEEEEAGDVDYKPGNKIKILDYNLRYTDDPEGTIKERSVRLREVMKKYTPDVCGFQEIVPAWVTYLSADYADYGYHVQYRATNSKEGTMVMWNTKTMEKLETGHFWLSPTPDVMSSGDEAWGESGFYRVVTWAKVKVKATGSTFVYFATHQNNAGTHPENSGKTIVNQARKLGVGTKIGGFCMGDYNVMPWSDGYMAMLEGGIFADINDDLNQDNSTTVNGYHTGASTNIIDFVFYTPAKVHPIHYEVVDMEVDGGYVSDHRGIYAEAALLY